MVAGGARDLFQPKGDIRLCAQVKLCVGMDREDVIAILADTPPFAVSAHEPFIKAETGLFTDGAGH